MRRLRVLTTVGFRAVHYDPRLKHIVSFGMCPQRAPKRLGKSARWQAIAVFEQFKLIARYLTLLLSVSSSADGVHVPASGHL